MKNALIVMLCLFLFGCTTASPILPFGPDTYKISKTEVFGCNTGKMTTSAIQKGNEYCQNLGKSFMPISTHAGNCSYDLTFRCLDEGDPELKRPDIEFVPDVVIEDRKE